MNTHILTRKTRHLGFLLAAALGLCQQAGAEFVAFNDHSPGTAVQTHPRASRWNINNAAPGRSGVLTNIADGVATTVVLTITTNGAISYGTTSGTPNAGTPLYNTFNGNVFFGSGTISACQVPLNATVTCDNPYRDNDRV